jgi:hypothetical protein
VTRLTVMSPIIAIIAFALAAGVLAAVQPAAPRFANPPSDASQSPKASSTPVDPSPNVDETVGALDDPAKIAEEELATLPKSAVQVDCNPVQRTLQPYLIPAGHRLRNSYILTDGRCFVDPEGPADLGPEPVEVVLPEPNPDADAP